MAEEQTTFTQKATCSSLTLIKSCCQVAKAALRLCLEILNLFENKAFSTLFTLQMESPLGQNLIYDFKFKIQSHNIAGMTSPNYVAVYQILTTF